MDPLRRAQIILLCDLCKTTHLQSHCERCDISLCKVCVGEHLSNSSIKHKVVPYKYRKFLNYSYCPDHADKYCKHYCEKCDIPVCSTCISSGEHKGHDTLDILEKIASKTQSLQNDLEELETRIYPRYEKMASDVLTEKAELETNYRKLETDVDRRGEVWHRETTTIVNQRKSNIHEIKTKHLSTINKNTEEITQKIAELKQTIADLKSIRKSNNVSLISTYKSRNSKFRTLPSFTPQKINKDQLNELLGSLSSLSINTEHGETTKSLLDEPRPTATINTGYSRVHSVRCLSEKKVWTCGNNNIMKLLNLQGKLLASIKTKSGNIPEDIAVTQVGNLVYIDSRNRTVNLVKNKQIQIIITLQGWKPLNVCSTASDDLLVTMISDDGEQYKVVRYSGTTETQTIQFDDQSRPLFSSGYHINKYISENKNLDICVADNEARAVVVVNQYGKLRFRYTGHPSNTNKSFYPSDITTDSQSRILTADIGNECIHILDQDGQFLWYIQKCHLHGPYGLCVDIRDNLFVAECFRAEVKRIQYCKRI